VLRVWAFFHLDIDRETLHPFPWNRYLLLALWGSRPVILLSHKDSVDRWQGMYRQGSTSSQTPDHYPTSWLFPAYNLSPSSIFLGIAITHH
jgi:hypothetical protein